MCTCPYGVWCKLLCHIKSDTGNSAHCEVIGCQIVWAVVTAMQMSAFCRTESIWHSHRREIAFFKHNETTQIKKLPLSNPSPPPHLTGNPTISVVGIASELVRLRMIWHSCSFISHLTITEWFEYGQLRGFIRGYESLSYLHMRDMTATSLVRPFIIHFVFQNWVFFGCFNVPEVDFAFNAFYVLIFVLFWAQIF